MKRRWLFYLFLMLAIFCVSTEGAKAGGGGRGPRGRGVGRGRVGGQHIPILIPNRNPASATYYGNKDVSSCRESKLILIIIESKEFMEKSQQKTRFFLQGATIVKASHFELDYMLGRKITFFCMARGYPRPEITWFKDGIELYHHKFFQVH